jgi:hypothetical protein
MQITVDLVELEDLARQFERNTTELAGITIDLRRRLSTDLFAQVAAYGLPTRGLAYESERIGEALAAHVGELERFTLDLERVWAEARGLARDGRLAPGVSGTASDLWWFRNASGGGDATESLAFAAATPQPAPGQGTVVAAAAVTGTSTGATADTIAAVINLASAEVGYVESGGAGGNTGNITKYWAELQPGFQGQPWCAAFVSWVFIHAGFPLPPMGQWYGFSYVPAAHAHFKGIGRFYPQPLPGDVFVFENQSHTGIVVSGLDAAGNFRTVEGNTSPGNSGSQTNGGGVYARARHMSQVMGFCRPDYASPAVA